MAARHRMIDRLEEATLLVLGRPEDLGKGRNVTEGEPARLTGVVDLLLSVGGHPGPQECLHFLAALDPAAHVLVALVQEARLLEQRRTAQPVPHRPADDGGMTVLAG